MKLNFIDQTGHTVIEDVDLAREFFNKALREGRLIYEADKTGKKLATRTFNPSAEEIYIYPNMVGG